MIRTIAALFIYILANSLVLAQVVSTPPGPPFLGDLTTETTPGAGYIGEVQSASVTTAAIINSTSTNITSKSIPAGHWSCMAWIYTNPAGTTVQTFSLVGLSTNSTPTNPSNGPGVDVRATTSTAGFPVATIAGPVLYNFTAATTVYVVADIAYSVSTLTINGGLQCQRIF